MMTSTLFPAPVLYVGIAGVLHPSESTYHLIHGRDPWSDGHTKYESVPILAEALKPYPAVRIVLTSTVPWKLGLVEARKLLGKLGDTVIGYTYEDLTTEVPFYNKSGKPRSNEDYWRMSKSSIVSAHVGWLNPVSWAALDDEDILWPNEVREARLVLTRGSKGLLDPEIQDRLKQVLWNNFGDHAPNRVFHVVND